MRKLENNRWSCLWPILFLLARIDLSSPEMEISSGKCSTVYLLQRWERGRKRIRNNYPLGGRFKQLFYKITPLCVRAFICMCVCVLVCLLCRILMGAIACTAMIMRFVMSPRSGNIRETATQKLNCGVGHTAPCVCVCVCVCVCLFECVFQCVCHMYAGSIHSPAQYNRWNVKACLCRFLPIHGAEWN